MTFFKILKNFWEDDGIHIIILSKALTVNSQNCKKINQQPSNLSPHWDPF